MKQNKVVFDVLTAVLLKSQDFSFLGSAVSLGKYCSKYQRIRMPSPPGSSSRGKL